MNIGILGSTSEIAKDLIILLANQKDKDLHLFARRPEEVVKWLNNIGLSEIKHVDSFENFGTQKFDVIINFVGVGNPLKAAAMGSSIFDVTIYYDELALKYLHKNPTCRYIFLSSGAAYCSTFKIPVDEMTNAIVDINNLKPQDWYGVSKLHAECRHRSLNSLSIVDIRVFNYFSSSQDMESRFLITDIVRSIRDQAILKTSAEVMVRDYITPKDFHSIINAILNSPPKNDVIDCYSKSPIEKSILLEAMKKEFGLQYEYAENVSGVNATGQKPNYYSLNKRASQFGYQPSLTSLEGIIYEAKLIFDPQ
jgi:nucleoside-diphosphate-sugar epimerase